ncbi:MAG: NAD(P)H-dependent oxidoreductase subunit E [Polyangiaceae bacterium]|nr:NAD(P)H-dependent oxidoreductase subunit E [Polyangiaceae bacterium]
MSEALSTVVKEACTAADRDPTRLMDIVNQVQRKLGQVSPTAMDLIASELGCQRVEVESVVSFYAFLSAEPQGKIVIRVCNDVIDRLEGADAVLDAFADALGIRVGETTPDGRITLMTTPCVGMSDQAPAALINSHVLVDLDPSKARHIALQLKASGDPHRLVTKLGDGNNAHELVQSMVHNNIHQTGPVVFAEFAMGSALRKALSMTPQEVIRDVKTSRIRGRGGAGFPTGMKWDFARAAPGDRKVVICNADEGEPGTFKDRVILTERASLMFEGMTIAGYAIGADLGILYLRAEYLYLRALLESILDERRAAGLLGKGIGGKAGFDFDIRIQMGGGAYVCGEETALISSCEGKRGDPKNRPPFPAQKGYLGRPSVVNNVETFCCVARVLEQGAGWFAQLGSKGTSGTKVLSVSGDCKRPGVYELEFGITLAALLKLVGAEDAGAVQVGGPSGQLVGPASFERTICYDDLATGGSIMVFNRSRDILGIARGFVEFFCEESCGYCTPCRVGNELLKERLDTIIAGRGEPSDLAYLEELGAIMKLASRCGLGQTSANPVLTTIKHFRPEYEARLRAPQRGEQRRFDFNAAVAGAERIAGHQSVQHGAHEEHGTAE